MVPLTRQTNEKIVAVVASRLPVKISGRLIMSRKATRLKQKPTVGTTSNHQSIKASGDRKASVAAAMDVPAKAL